MSDDNKRRGAAFDDTVVIRRGDPNFPSIVTMTLVAQAMHLGVIVNMGDGGEIASIRLPHPPPVVEALVRLATVWDRTALRIRALREGATSIEEDPRVQFAVYAERGRVWMSFGVPTEGLGLSPDQADNVARGLTASARIAREEPEVPDDGSGPIEA